MYLPLNNDCKNYTTSSAHKQDGECYIPPKATLHEQPPQAFPFGEGDRRRRSDEVNANAHHQPHLLPPPPIRSGGNLPPRNPNLPPRTPTPSRPVILLPPRTPLHPTWDPLAADSRRYKTGERSSTPYRPPPIPLTSPCVPSTTAVPHPIPSFIICFLKHNKKSQNLTAPLGKHAFLCYN